MNERGSENKLTDLPDNNNLSVLHLAKDASDDAYINIYLRCEEETERKNNLINLLIAIFYSELMKHI